MTASLNLMPCQLCGGWAEPDIYAYDHDPHGYAQCPECRCCSPAGKVERINYNWVHDLRDIANQWNSMQCLIAKGNLLGASSPADREVREPTKSL